jgi:acyl carrier protein
MELFSEIKAIIAKLLAVDTEAITEEAHLHFDLGADSLVLVNLATAISEKYGIELTDEDLVELENVGQLISLVELRVNT